MSAAELPRPVLCTVDNVACVLQKGSSEANAAALFERCFASSYFGFSSKHAPQAVILPLSTLPGHVVSKSHCRQQWLL